MSAFTLSASVIASQRVAMRGSAQGSSLRRAAAVPLRSGKTKAVSLLNTVAEGEERFSVLSHCIDWKKRKNDKKNSQNQKLRRYVRTIRYW